MIKQINVIKNIGKFRSYSASGDVEFRKVTMVYASNGQGKTTLAAIFRSLTTGNLEYIEERRRNTAIGDPEVIIKIENGIASLKNSSWNFNLPNIEIFDSHFINNNIFSGYHVEHEQKKNLCYFILGEDGTRLVTIFDELSTQHKEANQQKKQKEAELKGTVTSNLTVEDFVQSTPDIEIDSKISNKEKELRALQQTEKIKQTALLQNLVLIMLPIEECRELLLRSIDGVSQQAEAKTKQHIKTFMDEQGENWVRAGLTYVKDEQCPFCGRILSTNDLFKVYQDYFSSEYIKLKRSIGELGTKIASIVSKNPLLVAQQTLASNETNSAFWSEYVPFEYPSILFVEIQNALETLLVLLQEHISKKALAPLDVIEFSESLQIAISSYQQIISKIGEYNLKVTQTNQEISKKKNEIQNDNLQTVTLELKKLYDIKRRHEDPSIKKLCGEYKDAVALTNSLETQKKAAKEALDSYSETVFSNYQGAINEYLKLFGADFRIVDTKTKYAGASASTDYRISLFENSVDLATSFKSTLSEGDKSTLAFAFFISKLERDHQLAQKIIIIDDPIASLDIHRKTRTYQQIAKLRDKALQVIVLSHDADFLRLLWKHTPRDIRKTLKIVPFDNSSSNIQEWDTERETRGEYFESYFQLGDFIATGTADDLRAVARCIRPVLEGYFRVRFPKSFSESEWLGDFSSKIGDAQYPDINGLLAIKTDLDDIKEFSSKYHHAQNPMADSEPIQHATLKSYVQQTLELLAKQH